MRYAALLSMYRLTLSPISDEINKATARFEHFYFVVCGLRLTIYSVDYATDELIGKTIRQ